MTASWRFESELNVDLNEFQTNLVPFPRLHFMVTSMAPLASQSKKDSESFEVQSISESVFQPKNWFVKLLDFDVENDKYMAVSLNFRGDVKSKEANATVGWLKTNKKAIFVEWCPTGFKIGLNQVPCASIGDNDIASFKRNATMIGNNTSISRVFHDRI